MNQVLWRPEEDYALAFGAALGMPASNVAKSFGGDMTRNAVIGRANRIGISFSGHLHRPRKPKVPKQPKQRAPRKPINIWTPEQDAALIVGVAARKTSAVMAADLGHTESAVNTRRMFLGLTRRRRHFTDAEDAIIKADFASFVDVLEIARKLNRDCGTVRQRIFQLHLKRDGRKTRLAKKFGVDVLALSDDPAEIRRQLSAKDAAGREKIEAAERARIAQVIMDMNVALDCGEDRAVAFKAAMIQGATLQAIGDAVGLTRERVRQIVDDRMVARPKVQVIRTQPCRRCEQPFESSGKGRRWYCDPCREMLKDEKAEQVRIYQRIYQARLRPTPAHREYKRNYMRRSRLRAKLTELPSNELARLLRSVATEIETKGDSQ